MFNFLSTLLWFGEIGSYVFYYSVTFYRLSYKHSNVLFIAVTFQYICI